MESGDASIQISFALPASFLLLSSFQTIIRHHRRSSHHNSHPSIHLTKGPSRPFLSNWPTGGIAAFSPTPLIYSTVCFTGTPPHPPPNQSLNPRPPIPLLPTNHRRPCGQSLPLRLLPSLIPALIAWCLPQPLCRSLHFRRAPPSTPRGGREGPVPLTELPPCS